MPRGSKPGERRGGRKTGTPNKTTVAVKAALENAFKAIGDEVAFAKWARTNPTEFYRLWGKMLPADLNVVGGNIIVEIVKFSDEKK